MSVAAGFALAGAALGASVRVVGARAVAKSAVVNHGRPHGVSAVVAGSCAGRRGLSAFTQSRAICVVYAKKGVGKVSGYTRLFTNVLGSVSILPSTVSHADIPLPERYPTSRGHRGDHKCLQATPWTSSLVWPCRCSPATTCIDFGVVGFGLSSMGWSFGRVICWYIRMCV